MIITRIGPLSVARMFAILYALIGLLAGVFFSVAAILGVVSGGERGGLMGLVLGVGGIVVLPLLYGCLAFVTTLLLAWLYNRLASLIGGIEIDIH